MVEEEGSCHVQERGEATERITCFAKKTICSSVHCNPKANETRGTRTGAWGMSSEGGWETIKEDWEIIIIIQII
jgi:hypothetical protein